MLRDAESLSLGVGELVKLGWKTMEAKVKAKQAACALISK